VSPRSRSEHPTQRQGPLRHGYPSPPPCPLDVAGGVTGVIRGELHKTQDDVQPELCCKRLILVASGCFGHLGFRLVIDALSDSCQLLVGRLFFLQCLLEEIGDILQP
jgi:hypothetical protein